ncbi:MAG: thiamine-phosphate pyrophosphorylase [Candidatus Eisenbacteria bacterium]
MQNDEGRKLLRAIDANSNRVSEGLRVVEEIARFLLDDARLTETLKHLRHAIREATEHIGGSVTSLVEARESEGDVGRPMSTQDSSERKDVVGLVAANMRRSEEGLRVLEELSAAFDEEISNKFKKWRFELYTLEKGIIARLHG